MLSAYKSKLAQHQLLQPGMTCEIQLPEMQVSLVQRSPSSQLSGRKEQAPLPQVSSVHRSLSSHTRVSHGFVQPGIANQLHTPAIQLSVVHRLASSQGIRVNAHPLKLLQVSVVQR